MKRLSWGRLALSPGRRRIVRKWKSPPLLAYHVYCYGEYCCTAVLPLWIGRYVLLHCCCCAAVVGRSVGGWWVVGARWVAARSLPEMAGGRTKNKPSPVPCRGSSNLENLQMLLAHRYTAVCAAALLYCCCGLVGG